MSAKHTPGPWQMYADNGISCLVGPTDTPIARVHCGDSVANARLIAAAPELLDFVDEFIDAWKSGMAGDSYLMRIAEAVRAKATGSAA